LKGFVDLPAGNETALEIAIATVGPISVAIDASQSSFQFYSSGVYDDPMCSTTQIDHSFTLVGYDTFANATVKKEYYIAKNSWGDTWGDKGYIWMSRNKKNQCGIANIGSYPLV
jgi:cathepsin L